MQPQQLFWSVLNAAAIPVARRVYGDLTDAHKGARKVLPPNDSANESTARSPGLDAGVAGVSTDLLERVERALQATRGDEAAAPPVMAVALTEEPDRVFQTARRRAAWYFGLNLAAALGMMILFMGGAAGAIGAAVGWGLNVWSAVFGGMSVVGAFGLFIAHPLRMVYGALLATCRLDWLQTVSRQRMRDCGALPTLQEQIECRSQAWQELAKELETLYGR